MLVARKLFAVSARVSFAALFLVLLLSVRVSAQGVQDFVITSLSADYDLSNEDPQGLLKVREVIELDFSGQNSGILRAIPNTYKGNDLNLKVTEVIRDDVDEQFITYEEDGNTVVRIGNPTVYITGVHSYEIVYQVENVITFEDEHDEFFWDVNGDQWLQTFLSVDVQVNSSAKIIAPGTRCFSGVFGGTDSNCTTSDGANNFSAEATQDLGPSQTLTVVAAYEKGYFTPASWTERYRNFIIISPLILFQLLVVRSAHKKWEELGKDYKKRGVVAPYFGRPKGVSVMQASYVADNMLTQKHLSASIIDLAIRGYIKITETKEGRKTKHSLSLIKQPDGKLTDEEKMLVTELIGSSVDDSVTLEDKKNKLYGTFAALKKSIDAKTLDKGYYELSPRKSVGKLTKQIIAAFVGLFVGFSLAEYSVGVTVASGVISVAAVGVYAALMTKRSHRGNMLVEHMKGLKLYLSEAEKDRIEQQDAVAAPLAPHSGQPTRDVKFFEKLLPFAVAMGVEKSWAKAFSDVYAQPPDWYSGNWNTFSTIALVNSLGSTTKAATSSFTAPSSSGSSGFSGGGFSGGGGGGGGGGGW